MGQEVCPDVWPLGDQLLLPRQACTRFEGAPWIDGDTVNLLAHCETAVTDRELVSTKMSAKPRIQTKADAQTVLPIFRAQMNVQKAESFPTERYLGRRLSDDLLDDISEARDTARYSIALFST